MPGLRRSFLLGTRIGESGRSDRGPRRAGSFPITMFNDMEVTTRRSPMAKTAGAMSSADIILEALLRDSMA
jgi:hypothetical protein